MSLAETISITAGVVGIIASIMSIWKHFSRQSHEEIGFVWSILTVVVLGGWALAGWPAYVVGPVVVVNLFLVGALWDRRG